LRHKFARASQKLRRLVGGGGGGNEKMAASMAILFLQQRDKGALLQ
jgi:hypothetical protein